MKIVDAIYSTKYSGLKFWVFQATNGTVTSGSLDRKPVQNHHVPCKFREKIRKQTEDSFTFVYLRRGCSVTLKLK